MKTTSSAMAIVAATLLLLSSTAGFAGPITLTFSYASLDKEVFSTSSPTKFPTWQSVGASNSGTISVLFDDEVSGSTDNSSASYPNFLTSFDTTDVSFSNTFADSAETSPQYYSGPTSEINTASVRQRFDSDDELYGFRHYASQSGALNEGDVADGNYTWRRFSASFENKISGVQSAPFDVPEDMGPKTGREFLEGLVAIENFTFSSQWSTWNYHRDWVNGTPGLYIQDLAEGTRYTGTVMLTEINGITPQTYLSATPITTNTASLGNGSDPTASTQVLLDEAPGSGGLSAALVDPDGDDDGGEFTASYTQFASEHIDFDSFVFNEFTFALPGDTVQVWDLDYTGMLDNGELVELVFSFDPAGMSADEIAALDIFHFEDGIWTALDGDVNQDNSTIRVTTNTFSPFVVGTRSVSLVPVPAPLLLLLPGLLLWLRRCTLNRGIQGDDLLVPDPIRGSVVP